jgi:hypothetical protein
MAVRGLEEQDNLDEMATRIGRDYGLELGLQQRR